MLQEIKGLQEREHVLQKESLSVRLKVEHIDTAIAECHNKIKHWEKEVLRHIWKQTILTVYSQGVCWCIICNV